ncbi:unnamed protein product [Ceratitis capitata]|uniref:(Mediterranean fruit fly) hypothetical protein n=1 Tax=Ceratitis capitata TaxID=7213 RepID=A0A811VB09_CERCA|nr:unnamed protein product [Ceratitis capitata]
MLDSSHNPMSEEVCLKIVMTRFGAMLPTTLESLQRRAPDKTLPGISGESSHVGQNHARAQEVAGDARASTTMLILTDEPINTKPWSVPEAEELDEDIITIYASEIEEGEVTSGMKSSPFRPGVQRR